MKIFLPLVGQHENIGDIVLRRELKEWLESEGQLFVYVGASSDAYDRALELPQGTILFRSVTSWARALVAALRADRNVVYVYKPGEIQLTWIGLKEHIGLLPLVVATRLRGGRVLRVGVGSRNFDKLPTILFRMTLPLSHYTAWRDTLTARVIKRGEVMPDLGYGQSSRATGTTGGRNRLTVTMRGDQATPSDEWRRVISDIADDLGLRITVVTQVERDEQLSKELAEHWDADYVPWKDRDHTAQERAIRRAFAESALVVSDRLHALIVALTEGAAVSVIADSPGDKIARHFAAAEIPIQVVDTSETSRTNVRSLFSDIGALRSSQTAALESAQDRLREVRTTVVSTIRRRRG